MTNLWVPGLAPAPQSLADFVKRVHGQIERYTAGHAEEKTDVEVELAGGERLVLQSLSPEPGYGFVTLATHQVDGGDAQELIIPAASIRKITLRPEPPERTHFGFSLPSDRAAEREETEPAA